MKYVFEYLNENIQKCNVDYVSFIIVRLLIVSVKKKENIFEIHYNNIIKNKYQHFYDKNDLIIKRVLPFEQFP